MRNLQVFLPPHLRGSVTVRRLQRGDVERILAYFDSLGAQSKRFFHPHPFDRESALKICSDTDGESYRIVAEHEGCILGYAWFSPPGDRLLGTVGIAVSDDFQGKRLGGALVDALVSEAGRRGLRGLSLTVYKDNDRALRLYTSRGFEIAGEEGPQHIMDLVFGEPGPAREV